MFNTGFPPEWSTIKKLIWLVGSGIAGASYIWKTLTGTLIHITDALASPMQKCEVTLEPIQEGSGDPSPDNVRPITGWTGCEVTRTGANLFDKANAVSNERFNSSGPASMYGTSRSDWIPCQPNTSYYVINVHGSATMAGVFWYDSSKTFIAYSNIVGTSPISGVVTSPANAYYMGINMPNDSVDNASVNYPSTDTDYHAYSGTTLSVTFPDSAGTVYGGTVDLVSGVLTVKMASVDMGTLTWLYSAPIFYTLVSDSNHPTQGTQPGNIISSQYKVVSRSAMTNDGEISLSTNKYVNVIDSRYSSAAEFKTAMSGVQLVYELATPIEIQLTPQQISTLKGENNVWSNGDSVKITYKAQAE